ncbi:MAG TPA: hypothetical protein VG710_08420, partial [Opitutus sp.]|nr:hypothetical protein [Opitutus sp.]
ARVLIHVDDASPMAPARYLRYFVLQSSDGSNWTTESDAYLPNGAYVVPRDPTAVAGLLPAEVAWTRPSDGDTLRSTSLRQSDETSVAVASSIAEHWAAIVFSSRGSTADQFALVLATGRRSQGPGSPVTLDDPDSVRGFAISAYGVTALVNGRSGF